MSKLPLVALSSGLLLIGSPEKDPQITFPLDIPPAVSDATESTVKIGIFNDRGVSFTDPTTNKTEIISFGADLLSVGSGVKISDDTVITAGHVIAGNNKSKNTDELIQTKCGDALVWGQYEDSFFASHADPTGIYYEYPGPGLRDFGLLKVGVEQDSLLKTFDEIPDATIGSPVPYSVSYIASYQSTPEGENRGPGAEFRGLSPDLNYPTTLGAYTLATVLDSEFELILLATDPNASLEGADPVIKDGASGSPIFNDNGNLVGIVSGKRDDTTIEEIEHRFGIETPFSDDTRINLVVGQILGDSIDIGEEIAVNSGCEKSPPTLIE